MIGEKLVMKRSASRSLSLLVVLAAACSQVIGLGDYEKTDEATGGGAGTSSAGTSGAAPSGGSAGAMAGGTSSGGEVAQGGSFISAGAGAAEGGAMDTGGSAGASAGGTLAEAGSAGVPNSEGGAPSEGGTSGAGGALNGAGGSDGGFAGTDAGGAGGQGGTGAACFTKELLSQDGNFDHPDLGLWQEDTSYPLVFSQDDTPVTARSGTYLAWFGDADTYDEYLDYPISLPAGTTSVTASCYVWTLTEETTTTDAYDVLDFQLVASDYDVLVYRFARRSNLDATSAWTRVTYTASAADFADEPAYFELHSLSDDSDVTHFFVDSCSLTATNCP